MVTAVAAVAAAWLATMATTAAWLTAMAAVTTAWLATVTATIMAAVTAAIMTAVTAIVATIATAIVAAIVATITAAFLTIVHLFTKAMLNRYIIHRLHGPGGSCNGTWLGNGLFGFPFFAFAVAFLRTLVVLNIFAFLGFVALILPFTFP